MEKRYQVFISSTYADLKEERSKVMQAIMELDCIPAGMELFPAIDDNQFEFIKKVIDDCDYYLLIIGGRYGSLSQDDGISYTEKEFDYAVDKGVPVIALIHGNPDAISFGKSERDEQLRKRLDEFKSKVSTNRLVKFWNNAEELPGLVALSLSKTIKIYPGIGWVRGNTANNTEVLNDLNIQRKENDRLIKELEGLQTNNKNELNEVSLAGLNDIIKVYGSNYNNSHHWKTDISWERLFAIVSPYLLSHPSDKSVRDYFAKLLPKEILEDVFQPTIDEHVFQTIKIQFIALGLVNVKYSKTTSGNMGLFWNLTKLGNDLMIHIRSIKKWND